MPATLETPPPSVAATRTTAAQNIANRIREAENKGKPAAKPEGTQGTEGTKGTENAPSGVPPSGVPPGGAAPNPKPDTTAAAKAGEKPAVAQTQKEIDFARLNADFDKTRAEFNAKLKTIETERAKEREELTAQLTTTKTELQKREEFLERFYLETDERFVAKFNEATSEAVGLAKRAAGREMAPRVEAVFNLPPGEIRDQQFAEIHAEMPTELGKARLMDAYKELEKTQYEREKALANSRENRSKLKELDAQNAIVRRAEEKRLREALYEESLAKGESVFDEFKLIEGNEEHNKRALENRRKLKSYVTEDLSPADLGNLATFAIKGMTSVESDAAKDELIGKLQAQIQKLTGAVPGLQGEGAKPGQGEKKVKLTVKELAAQIDRNLSKARV